MDVRVLTSCRDPAAGMASKAARPDFTDENGTPKAMSPGSLLPAVVIMWPSIASIEIRPCFTSTYNLNSNIDTVRLSHPLRYDNFVMNQLSSIDFHDYT